MATVTCDACGAQLRWARHWHTRRRIPLARAPRGTRRCLFAIEPGEDGDVAVPARSDAADEALGVVYYVDHWMDCANGTDEGESRDDG